MNQRNLSNSSESKISNSSASISSNFSLIETQPSVHFSLINQFLIHTETISLFSCSHRLYSIPLEIPIFLFYYNKNIREKINFDFNILFLQIFTLLQLQIQIYFQTQNQIQFQILLNFVLSFDF